MNDWEDDDIDRSLEERAALKLAEKQGHDPEDIRYCLECGRTVIYKRNHFRTDSKTDSVFCTCDDTGPPMVTPRTEGGR